MSKRDGRRGKTRTAARKSAPCNRRRRPNAPRHISVRIGGDAYAALAAVAHRMNERGGIYGTRNTARTVFNEFLLPLCDRSNLSELVISGIDTMTEAER